MYLRSVYDEMIAVGAFSSIEDMELKSGIFRAFNVLAAEQTQIDYFRSEVGRASEVINGCVSFSYDSSGELVVDYQTAELCKNIVFRNAIVEIIDARGDWIYGLGMITSFMEGALEAIEILNQESRKS